MSSRRNSYTVKPLLQQIGLSNVITTHFSGFWGFQYHWNLIERNIGQFSPTDMTAVTPLNTVTQFDRSSQLLSDLQYRLLESNLW